MKFTTTSAALAVAATGAAAQDSWSAWASTSKSADPTKSCPATITSYTTETATVYEKTSEVFKATVTIPIPDKPATVDIKPNWADWDTTTSTAAETVTKAPAGCTGGKTITGTSTVTSTKAGTTTVTHSILFVAAEVTGSADAAWDGWNPGNDDSDGSSDGGNGGQGNGNGGQGWNGNPNSGNGNGNNGWNGNGDGSNNGNGGKGNGNGWNGNGNNGWNNGGDDNSDNDGTNGNNGWGKGSWGGKGTGGEQLGQGNDVFHWDIPVVAETSSGVAPQYTQRPDGTYGGTPYGAGEWGNWPADDDTGSDGGQTDGNGSTGGSGGVGGKNGTTGGTTDGTNGNGGTGNTGGNGNNGGKNDTIPINNGQFPAFGSPASNLTKPHDTIQNSCNTAADRSKWCDGKDTSSDYYQDYFTNRRCTYDLTITNGTWNQDGDDVMTFLINGQFPGPAIECNWGDMVVINVHNQLQNNGTAIHWHGIRQSGSNDMDGVPGVTECAIAPGSSRTYVWRASSYGTSWYHSHWGLQYGDGIQGPIIIHGPATANYDVDAGPVMIDDTYGMTASAFGSILAHVGPQATVNYLLNGKNVKPDLSAGQHALWKVQKGKKYLFRLINSASQNNVAVSIDQHKFQVIAADFVPIVPYTTEWLNIGIGQRYDVVVDMNQNVGSYFLRVATQTLCPAGSLNTGFGQGNGIIAYEGVSEAPLLLPTSTVNGNLTVADFDTCQDEPLASLVPFLKKGAGTSSAFTSSASTLPGGKVGLFNTADDGAVFRWLLNNGAMYINYTQPTLASLEQGIALNESAYANPIVLEGKNQWVYFVIQNQFGASHPMHLHGHDFSVLGEGWGLFTPDMVSTLQFDNPIRRDTAMLRGGKVERSTDGGYTVIGFETDNPGAWLMHCHIAWHVDQGLALQWIERPDDIKALPGIRGGQFKDECDSYAAYEAQGPQFKKFSGGSGLRRRENTYFDKMVLEASRSSVVRRDEGAHHYLSSHLRRGLGDGGARRTFGRR